MATYATAADLEAHVDGTAYESMVPAQPEDVELLLERAERDLDLEAFVRVPRRASAPKLLPAELDVERREGLVQAACAQAVYRLEMGDEHFVRAQRQRVSTKSFSSEGRLPILGPAAQRELTAADLWQLTTSSTHRRGGESSAEDWQRH